MEEIYNLVMSFGAMAGFAALVAVLINVLKTFGVVKDGDASKWSAILNLVGLVGLVVAKIVWPDLSTSGVDAIAGLVAGILVVVLGYVVQIVVSSKTHNALADANIPLLGKSYSREVSDAYNPDDEALAGSK
mgnify:CR=1 FL=1